MNTQAQLTAFITWWQAYCTGDEKGEAQIFLDRLLQAFGHQGALEAGGRYEERVRRRRGDRATVAFADYVLPGRCLIEMKKRGEDLRKHYDQLEDYWKNLERKPRYALLCNFDEIWVYDFPTQFYDPVDFIRIAELPERTAALTFLLPHVDKDPVFRNNLVEVTKNAAHSLSLVFQSLLRRLDRPVAQRFILQCMLALFAEDIGLLPDLIFTRTIEEAQQGDASTYDLITLLFFMMNTPGVKPAGRFYGVDYFDGGLFSEIHPLQLGTDELRLLRAAARENWSRIRPAIFGTIFEDSLDKAERHQIGAHFTNERDIKLIVDPVIVEPWQARIDAAESSDQLRALHAELCAYQVLDPACGSGNFLYIAYREMKKLERIILNRIDDLAGQPAPPPEQYVTARQFWGYDVNDFAVELAKVTLMIGRKLAVDELGLAEAPLPLDNLDEQIRCEDALFAEWPAFDACIGNPPYLGAKRLKQEHSVAYINRVRKSFPDVPGNADYCVYWFRKAHDLMLPGARAGLVGTSTIRENYSRIGGLDYIVEHDGHIYDAVSSMPWSGEAVVHVSIACWSKGEPPHRPARLRYYEGPENRPRNGEEDESVWRVVELPAINSALSERPDVSDALTLACNTDPKRAFQGLTPGHKGFVLSRTEAQALITHDPGSAQVIFPYMTGSDLVGESGGKPSRFIIDLNQYDSLEAQQFKGAYERIKAHVLPDRQRKADREQARNQEALAANPDARLNTNHQQFLETWWQHSFTRVTFTEESAALPRYIICSRVSRRSIFDLVSPKIRISDKVQAFLFSDDYSFGILQSDCHWQWWLARGQKLKSDPSYVLSVFDTFPWPQQPSAQQVKAVATAAQNLHEYRRTFLDRSETLTLRKMYRTLELPGKNPLRDLHAALDKAVLAAYGFDPAEDVLFQLLHLNYAVAARIEAGEPVTPPGIPPDYPAPEDLISAGCIIPPELL